MARRLGSAALLITLIAGLASIACSGGKLKGIAVIEIEIDGIPYDPDSGSFSFDIGSIAVNGTRTFTIAVFNTGHDKDLEISGVTLDYTAATEEEGPDPADMAFNLGEIPSMPAFIAPINEGTDSIPEVQYLHVVFKRLDDPLQRSATLTILNDDDDNAQLDIVFATKRCDPQLSVPSVVDFGQVHDEKIKDIVLSNTGSCGLIIGSFIFDGHQDYTLVAEGQEYPTSEASEKVVLDPPLEIPPNSGETWQVRYNPQTGDPAQAELFVFPTNDEDALDGRRIEVLANTSGPCIKIAPSPVEFGGKLIGQPAKINVDIKSCGTGALNLYDIYLKEDSSLDFQLIYDDLPGGVKPTPEEPLVVAINDSVTLSVQFVPDQQNPVDPTTGKPIKDVGTIVISNNTFETDLEVETNGFGVLVECPQPIIVVEEGEEVPPQTIIHLHGDQSQASSGSISSYQWSLDQPEENKFNLIPTYTFPNPTHEVNVAGTYTYCLDVCDAQFCSNDAQCNTTACKKVVVVPDQAIHCELTWDTPGDLNQFDEGPDAGSDMDIHFTHPFATGPDLDGDGGPDGWFDLTYDCFWYNPEQEWESMNPNVSDDPSLDRDDTDGAGPENINLDVPVDGRVYKIGVHYWDDHGFGASYPTVKCWIFGQHVFEKNLKELGVNGVKMFNCDMWEAATIEWPSGKVTAVPGEQSGMKITHCYQNPAFVQIGGDTCDCN